MESGALEREWSFGAQATTASGADLDSDLLLPSSSSLVSQLVHALPGVAVVETDATAWGDSNSVPLDASALLRECLQSHSFFSRLAGWRGASGATLAAPSRLMLIPTRKESIDDLFLGDPDRTEGSRVDASLAARLSNLSWRAMGALARSAYLPKELRLPKESQDRIKVEDVDMLAVEAWAATLPPATLAALASVDTTMHFSPDTLEASTSFFPTIQSQMEPLEFFDPRPTLDSSGLTTEAQAALEFVDPRESLDPQSATMEAQAPSPDMFAKRPTRTSSTSAAALRDQAPPLLAAALGGGGSTASPGKPTRRTSARTATPPLAQFPESALSKARAAAAASAQATAAQQKVGKPAGRFNNIPAVAIALCSNCGTENSSLWRRNPSDGEPLCNACGLFLKLHGSMRPVSMKSDVIKKRNRGGTAAPTRSRGRRAADSSAGSSNNSSPRKPRKRGSEVVDSADDHLREVPASTTPVTIVHPRPKRPSNFTPASAPSLSGFPGFASSRSPIPSDLLGGLHIRSPVPSHLEYSEDFDEDGDDGRDEGDDDETFSPQSAPVAIPGFANSRFNPLLQHHHLQEQQQQRRGSPKPLVTQGSSPPSSTYSMSPSSFSGLPITHAGSSAGSSAAPIPINRLGSATKRLRTEDGPRSLPGYTEPRSSLATSMPNRAGSSSNLAASVAPKIDPAALYEKLGALIELSRQELVARGEFDLANFGNSAAAGFPQMDSYAAAMAGLGQNLSGGSDNLALHGPFTANGMASSADFATFGSSDFVRVDEPGNEVDWIVDHDVHEA